MGAKTTRLSLIAFSFLIYVTTSAQNVAINTAGTLPTASAILDLSNTASLAFLPPQVALTKVNVLAPVPAPGPVGLVVYSTTAPAGGGGVGLYLWSGGIWNYLSMGAGGAAWNLTGNAATNPAINYAGTSDAEPFIIKTQATERMRFLAGGGAGIGTATPMSGVDVNGSMGIGTYAGVNAAPANGVIISGQVGVGNSAPNASAIMDLTNAVNNLGFLLPNMTTGQRNAIGAPAKGLMVFNNTTGCINFWTGFAWENVACPTCTAAPATPGVITGPVNPVISSSNNIYSIAVVPGSVSYTWSITPSSAGTIATGQGTTSINITFGAALLAYTICVHDSNACGVSANSCMVATTINCTHSSNTWVYSGGVQTWVVPNCITQVTISMAGGQGGSGGWTSQNVVSQGGNGGSVSGVLAVVGGTTLDIYVGGAGAAGNSLGAGAGGYNGGASGWWWPGAYWGGGGGGASDIRVTPYALANRKVVAGGGGGGAFNYNVNNWDQGGPGGGATGGAGYSGNTQGTGSCGFGGTQLAGGAGGTWGGYCTAFNGALGLGGADCNSASNAGGGGGGGYYGGGGGCWSGGGGGSNYTGGLTSTSSNGQGTQTGNGFVTIQW